MDSLNPLNRRNFLKLGAGGILASLLQTRADFLKTGTPLRTPVLNILDAICEFSSRGNVAIYE